MLSGVLIRSSQDAPSGSLAERLSNPLPEIVQQPAPVSVPTCSSPVKLQSSLPPAPLPPPPKLPPSAVRPLIARALVGISHLIA